MRAVATCPFVYKALSTQRRAPPRRLPKVAAANNRRHWSIIRLCPYLSIFQAVLGMFHAPAWTVKVPSEDTRVPVAVACCNFICRAEATNSCLKCMSGGKAHRVLTMERLHGAPLTDPGRHPRRDGGGPGAHPHQRAQHLVRLRAGLPQLPRGRARGCAPAPHRAAMSAGGAGARSCAQQRARGSQRAPPLADMHIHGWNHTLCWRALRNKGGGSGTRVCTTCAGPYVGSRGACS